MGLLIAHIAAVTLHYCPWRWRHPGLAVVPVGMLVLLAGILQTSLQKIEGQLILKKGDTASSVLLTGRSLLTVMWRGGQEAQSIELGFSPGPVDWRVDEPLDFGEVDGLGIKVLKFYRHARFQSDWIVDEAEAADPAIQVAVSDAQGHLAQGTLVHTGLVWPAGRGRRTRHFH